MNSVRERELAYHEKLYSGLAQSHFARPAVRALRRHMVAQILKLTGAGAGSRVLSLGCGIGDTELLLARHVAEVVGVDLSPAAIRQARADAEKLGVRNARFEEGGIIPATTTGAGGATGADGATRADGATGTDGAIGAAGRYDVAIAVFFLHHLPDEELDELPGRLKTTLNPGGVFYSLDPSSRRLSAAVGRRLIPNLMKKYQTADERELEPAPTAERFRRAGFETRVEMYDFGSSPLAGLFPGWAAGYRVARRLDDVLLRAAWLRRRGSNFEVVARLP
ncbi:MAG TPA: class I SAM-dependent methyltransferase [Candidatus Solibacter sp.]|nr:class I SAM-dependent methyltransferase [Candidatus Solibacter sp.]